MISILFAPFFCVMVIGLGWPIINKLDEQRTLFYLEKLSIAFVFGCYVLYLFVFIIGPIQLDIFSISFIILVCVGGAYFGLKSFPWRRMAHKVASDIKYECSDSLGAFLLLLLLLISLTSVLQALAPPNDYDGLAYHLAFPRLDIETGRIIPALKTTYFATFFPTLGSHLTRVALVISNAESAQVIHSFFGLIGAVASGALAMRVGYGRKVALSAAILFLSIRMTIWQMGTVETDVPTGALAALTLVVYIISRNHTSIGIEIVFGLLMACTILMKYHGFVVAIALAPLMFYDLVVRRKSLKLLLLAPIIALTALAPHLIRNSILTGNPVYPLLPKIFSPDTPNILDGWSRVFGTGDSIFDLLLAPWNIFILPTHYFDGMVFGGPYLLALCPLIFLKHGALRKWGPILSYVSVFFCIWFWELSQQVRFLAPIMPILASLAAAGVSDYWRRVKRIEFLKPCFVSLLGVLALNQLLFIGIFSMIRLPVAVGLISPSTYHNKTPTMGGAYYSTCKFIEKNLKKGERYFLYAAYISYYCPQKDASLNYLPEEEGWWLNSETPPTMSEKVFIQKLHKYKFRFFLVQLKTEHRRSVSSAAKVISIDYSSIRFGDRFQQAFKELKPLAVDKYSAVFDGEQILNILSKNSSK